MTITRDLRSALHSAFVAVRSREANLASSNITLDHLIKQQLKFLKKDEKRGIVDPSGVPAGERLSLSDKIDILESDLSQILDTIRKAQESDSPEDALESIGIYEVNDKYLGQESAEEEDDSMQYSGG